MSHVREPCAREHKYGQPQRHGRATWTPPVDQAAEAAAFFERGDGAGFFLRGMGPAIGFMVSREPVL